MDYLIKVGVDEALAAAGVPLNSPAAAEITQEVEQRLSDELTDALERAVLAQHQNPFRVDFLRISRATMYRPAYVVIYVHNYSETRMSRPGQVGFSSGSGFDVFATRYVDIPALEPGESVIITMYLDHLRGKYIGYEKYFDELYYGHSDKPYELYIGANFDLPDVLLEAERQGLERAPLPYVTRFEYDRTRYDYRSAFIPAEYFDAEDAEHDHEEFMD
ncbi:MAG: hypothetical protein GX561_06700 [Lentisphaerae bacterium]|nr:hypothetical protein [Lentisphaerota bacterium]